MSEITVIDGIKNLTVNIEKKRFESEKILISRLQKGHEGAFRILMQQYQSRLFSIAFGITAEREESLEIVQEVFLKVFKNIDSFKTESKLSTWLYRIAVNESLNWKRKWKRRFRWHHQQFEQDDNGDYPEMGSDGDNPETAYREKEFEKLVLDKLTKLPEKSRIIFVLNVIEGLSYDEIASLLKIKKGTVSSRLYYAKEQLRKVL